MNYFWIIIVVLYIILTHLIAKYIGAKREIGFRNSVFWSILGSPITGFIITILSKKIGNKASELK